MTIIELEKQLKNSELNSIYLLYGEELYLLESVLKRIKNKFENLVKGINYVEIDENNIDKLIQEMQTPAFGFPKKLIVVKNTNIFKREAKRKNGKVNDEKDKIAEYIKENINTINETMILVFIEESVDKGKLFFALEEVNATICNFEYQKPDQIISRLKAICKAYKVAADDNTLRYFVEVVGINMQDLINEIRKQIEYIGENGKITKESINLLAIKQIDSVIFDLTDNLGKRNVSEALTVLNNLIYSKEPIQKILITLYNHFKKIYIAKLAIKHNRDIAESMNLKPNQMFLTTKYKIQSGYFKEYELKQILIELINLDKNYKQGLIDLNVGLESIICRYC